MQISYISPLNFFNSFSRFFLIFSFSSFYFYSLISYSLRRIFSSSFISSTGLFIQSSLYRVSPKMFSFLTSKVLFIISFKARIPESSFANSLKRYSSLSRIYSRRFLSSLLRTFSNGISSFLTYNTLSASSIKFFWGINISNGF